MWQQPYTTDVCIQGIPLALPQDGMMSDGHPHFILLIANNLHMFQI